MLQVAFVADIEQELRYRIHLVDIYLAVVAVDSCCQILLRRARFDVQFFRSAVEATITAITASMSLQGWHLLASIVFRHFRVCLKSSWNPIVAR
ncbi:hypothetical protein AYI70_g10549, partial [Smittium culicis]